MGVHCINPKSKDFLNISKRLNISPANLEDIIHKYQYENDTDEYPSDDYIKAALEGTRTTMSQEQVDLWERYYQKPKRFKTLQELNRAKQNALKFFRKEAISEYIDADGNYVLKVAKAKNTRQLFYSKSPNLRQQLIEEAKSKLRDYYRQLVIPTNTEQEYIKALALKRKMDKRIFYSPNNSDDQDSQRQREIASTIENIKKEIPSYLLKNIRQIVLHNGGIKLQIDLNPESLIKESYIDSVINSWIDDMSNDSILNEAERIDLAETSEAYYINPKKKQEILSQIKKRAKLTTQEEINEAIDFLETLENSPELNLYVATCIQWLKTDSILLPRDNEKLLTLFQSARKLKLDVQKYKNPIELMVAVANAKSGEIEQGTKVNPEAISQLTFNTIITNSKGEKLYVYDVEDSPSGQEAVCQMLADASPKRGGTVLSNSPWCLSTFNYNKDTGKATPTESARRYWNKYNRGKRQIALLNNETPIAFNSSSSNKDEWWDFYDGQYNSFKGYSDIKSVDTSSAKKVYKKSQHQYDIQVIRLGDYAYDMIRNTIMRKTYTNGTGFTVHKSNEGLDITLNNYHRHRYIFLKNYHGNDYSYNTFRLRAGNYGISIQFDNNRIQTIEINYITKKGKYKINYNFPFKGSIIEQAIQEAVAFIDKHKSDSIAEFNSTNIAQAKEIANKLLNNDDIFNSIKEYSEELIRKEEEEKEQKQQEPVKQPSAEIQEALQTNNQRLQEINTIQAVQEYLVDNEEQANQAQEYNIEDQEEEADTQETTQSTVSAVEEREYTIDEETQKTLEEVNKKTKKKFSIKDLLRLSKLLKERDIKDLYNEAIGQKVNSELETILKDILKEYHFEAWEGDLKEIFGNDILGATDFINKIIYLAQSKNRNAITMPEEFAHSFIKLMGARYRKETYTTSEGEVKKSRGLHPENKEYSELRDLVEQTSLYKQVYDLYSKDKQYQFPNGTPNTIKIKEEAVGQALAAVLTNRYKAKTEAEANWYERLKLWFNDILNAIAARLQPNAERQLRRRMTKIADSILDGSYREKYLDKFDSSKYQLLDYNETIQNMTQRDNGYTLQLLKDISLLGGVVTGSLSYRAQGTVYRKGQDLIHDIDVIVPESKSKLSARHPSFKRYNSMPLQDRWTQDKLIEVAKETDYYQKLKDKYPDLDIISSYVSQDNKLITNAIICSNQELKNKFINMEEDFNSRMDKLTQEERDQIRLIDLFFELDDKIADQTFIDTQNNINLANYGVSFEEKMKFARAKDIFDYQKFNPFSRMRPVDTSNMSLMFQKTPVQPVFSTRQEMLNTMIQEADGFIGEVSQSPYTKVGNKFVIKNNTEVEKAVNYISKRGVHKDRKNSLLSKESIKYLTEDKDNTSYYNIGYSSGEPYITAVTNRELFDENYTPKTIMFLRDQERLNEDIIKTQLESFKDTSTFLVDASDTKAIEFFDKNGYNYKVYQVGQQQSQTQQQVQSQTQQQQQSTQPTVTKIISGGQTGVDTIGLQVAKELGIETGGTAPKGFLRESGIDEEDISSYNLTEITDEEQADYTKRKGKNDPYTGRTELNVRNSDGTVYFYTSDDELGMRATKRSAEDWGKPFITNPTAEQLKQWLIDNNIKTLNVAGNRGSKLDKNNNVAKILRDALTNKPKQQKEEKRDPYRERQQEITRQLDALQESSLMTNIEIREIAEQVVYWISDHITELQQNPELAVKIYGDTVKNLNTQEASRIEIVNAIGLDNIKEMCKQKFSPKNAGYTKISTIRKANLIIDNWDAIMQLASDVFTDIEKFSITETVVADKVVSQTNENLNNNQDNFNAEEQNDEESILETHGNLQEHWQTKANTIDIMDSMSQLMHRVIAQCYQLEEVSRDENNKPIYDKVKSEFGINLRVKPREVTGSLLRWCQGCLNIKDVITNLKAKESANPWISQIITKLEDNSGNESDFQSQFFGVFVKPFMSYSIVKIDENGNYISQVVNKNPALKETVKGITTLYKMGEHPMFKSDGAVNKETFKQFSEAMKELANLDLEKNKDKIAHNLGFMYNALGFSITSDLVSQILDEDTYKTLTTQFGYIHKSLYDNQNIANPKDYEPLKFRGKGSFLGTLNKVLKPITDTLEDTAVSAFYDNGNMYQSYVTPSYMTKLMSKFHLDGEKFDQFIINEYGKYDWFKEHNSRDIERGWKLPILRELVTNPKAREVFDHKVQLTFNKHQYMKKMDDTEVTLAILAEYWAETTRSDKKSGRIPAWFRVPMLSNKPSAEYIKFYSERGINYQDVITDNVYKIFLQEMGRIQTVMMRNYGKQDPEFIKNFDKNGKKFNFVDFMNEYLTGDSKNSQLGKLIQSKLNGQKLNSQEELMFSDLAKQAIKEALTKKAESIVDNFERKGIFEGAKKIEGIDKDNIREELINFVWNDTYMSMNILQLTITDIAYYKDAEDLQKRLAQIHAPGIRANQYATDYQGNPVSDGKLRTIYLKDFDSFISNIVDNVSVVFDRKIKNAKTEEEKQGYRVLKESIVEQFKNINVADAQGYSSPTSYRKKALLFGKWSKEAEDIYRKLISGEYTYSDLKTAFQPLKPFVYTQIEKSSNVNSDEAPMTNLKVGVQNKNSEYLLIMADALLQGEDTGKPNLLRALYSVMEESSIDVKETTLNNGKKQRVRTPRIDGLDTVQFESTVKAGLRGAIDINQFAYDEDGERKAKEYIESLIGKNGAYNETYVDEIPVEDYCLQQEIPAHFRGHEQAHGSQIRAITPSDLESVDAQGNPITYNVEGKELTAEQFKTEYEKTIAANIEDSIETLTKELNLGPEATQVDKNRALEKILRREILSSPRYGVDLLQACTLNEEGQFRIPKGDPIQSKRIEQLLNSIIKNRVNKQEIAGGPVVQVSNFGTSRELNIKFKAKGGGLLMTRKEFEKSPLAKKVTATSQTDKFNARYGKTSKTMTYEQYIEENQAGIAYFEVFAPIYLNDIFEKFQNPDGSIDIKAIEELNPDLLKMIGYRIPTEDKYSCAPLKIVGFLPKEAGDTIMLPNDITLLTGSDFDIDKEYLMRKDIPITLRDKKDIFDDMFQHFTANKNLSKEAIKDIKNAINLFLDNPNPKLLDFSKSQDRVLWTYYKKFAYKAEAPTEGRTYRNNKIVDMTWEVLTHESNADKILNPGGFEPQKKMGYLISAYRNPANTKSWEELVAISKQPKGIDKLKELCYTEKNLCYIDTHIQFYKQNSAAGSLIGTFAVHKTAHAILESDGFKIDIESICPPFMIDGMEFNNGLFVDPRYDRKGNLIGKTLGSLVASAADAVKDPILNLMNINSNTSNVLNTLIRLGMDFDTAALFLSQTAITNILEEHSKRNITEYTSLNKVIKERCEELEGDYSIDETLLTQEPITMDELISGLNPDIDSIDPKTEYRILKAFSNLQNIGSAMRSLTRVTRFNSVSSAVGPLIIDNLIAEHQLENFSEKILYKGESCGIEKVYQLHPQLRQFARTLDIARDLMSDMPANSNGFRYLLGASKSYKETLFGDRKLLSQLSDFYQSYALMASGVINSSELESYIKDFPAQFIKNYQQKYKSNPLINAIKTDVTSTGTAILKIDTTGLDQKAKDILSMAWIDLHKKDPELSTKLFIYNLFRGGVGFNPKTFTQLAPTYVKERIPNYISTYRKLPQVLNALVLDQFIRNNWNNNKLVPTKKVGLKAMENNPNTFEVLGEEATEEMKEVLYFKTKDSNGNYTLWRQTYGGANAIIVTYEKIQPLGNNGEYIEMSTTNIKESLDAKQTKELFDEMDNDIPESTIETQEESIEYTDQQIEDILYRAIETGNNVTTREQAIQKVQDYRNFSEEKQKKYEKSMRIFLNNALNKLGITVEEDLVNKVYNKMCK